MNIVFIFMCFSCFYCWANTAQQTRTLVWNSLNIRYRPNWNVHTLMHMYILIMADDLKYSNLFHNFDIHVRIYSGVLIYFHCDELWCFAAKWTWTIYSIWISLIYIYIQVSIRHAFALARHVLIYKTYKTYHIFQLILIHF